MDAVNFLNLEHVFWRITQLVNFFDPYVLLNMLIHLVERIRPIAILITLFMAYVIIYSHIKLKQMAKEQEEKFNATKVKELTPDIGQDKALHEKWQKVQAHINSNNPSDWRLAILEADIMLGDVLEKMGYQGDSIGEKLKSVDKSDFLTLQLAWDAHLVRNQIAHEGADFKLNEREAKEVIDKFKKVFEEFYHI
jgi:hypothetical protein